MSQIRGSDIKEYFASGGKFIETLAAETYGDKLNNAGRYLFSNTIDTGISNTIAALYDANIDDGKIVRLVNKYWGISKRHAEELLTNEKCKATARALQRYLIRQGLTDEERWHFNKSNKVASKIWRSPLLWPLHRSPKKLMEEVQK